MNDRFEKNYKTLVEAIHERYDEMLDDFSFTPSSPECETSSISSSSFDNKKDDLNTSSSLCSFYIPAQSPRKTQSGMVLTSCSLVMSNQNINKIGDFEALKRSCKNVIELDLAKNQISSWDEVKKLLSALKNLRLLNLSYNIFNTTSSLDLNQYKRYFNEWPEFKQLKILILNSCYLNLNELQYLINKLINLTELHLCSNSYDNVNFNNDFIKDSLKILYLNNNRLNSWYEVCKLGKSFPNLETLVISDNPLLSNFNDSHEHDHEHKFYTSSSFSNLQQLIMNKVSINDWSIIDQLRKFPQLKHVRIQNIPLLESYDDEEKYYLLVGHLDGPTTLNGSEISEKEKETCERKLIRYFLDKLNKPKRYYELECKHGKLNKLADINLVANNRVYVKIKFDEKFIYETIDVRQTVSEFKKRLEKFVGHPSNKFRVYYIDIEAMNIIGPEELKHPNRCLHSFNIRDGDEFEIDLKQQISTISSTESMNIINNKNKTTKISTNRPINKTFSNKNIKNNNNNNNNNNDIHHHPITPSPTPP